MDDESDGRRAPALGVGAYVEWSDEFGVAARGVVTELRDAHVVVNGETPHEWRIDHGDLPGLRVLVAAPVSDAVSDLAALRARCAALAAIAGRSRAMEAAFRAWEAACERAKALAGEERVLEREGPWRAFVASREALFAANAALAAAAGDEAGTGGER